MTVDGVSSGTAASRQPSNAVSTAAHHGTSKRPPGRVVQEKVGGEVGVEQILKHVLSNEDGITGFVVGVQLRHDEQVSTDHVTGTVTE